MRATTTTALVTTTTEPPLTCVGRVGLCAGVTVSESLFYINDRRVHFSVRELAQEAIWRPLGPCEWMIEWGLLKFRSEDSPEIEVHLGLGQKHPHYSREWGKAESVTKFAAIDPTVDRLFAGEGGTYGVYKHVFTAQDFWSGGLSRDFWIAQERVAPFVGVFKVFEDGSLDETWIWEPFVIAAYAQDSSYRHAFGRRALDAEVYLDLQGC